MDVNSSSSSPLLLSFNSNSNGKEKEKEEIQQGISSCSLWTDVWAETKMIWYIAAPAILTSIFQYSLAFLTQTLVGHIGTLQLAAFGIQNLVVSGLGFGIMVSKFSYTAAQALKGRKMSSNSNSNSNGKEKEENQQGISRSLWTDVWAETKMIWNIAVPVILISIFQYSLAFLTQTLVGHIGTLQLAAFGIQNLMVSGLGFGIMVSNTMEQNIEQSDYTK
ncbi:hypothetical protein GIB67_025444 [Kingdonia uniflora]|uniref:Uncharacterized protein n=1 Tax=Kingdonia uniflora TaxID=39325 RepID=A0A7J7N139_9MAGN|nr:hypothetical protein GIB67_025444 [Kingdonia uniflora]